MFLSLIFLCVLSLLLLLAESAYMAGIRWEFQSASGSSLDSVMSQYHKELWETYRILLLDLSEEEIEEEYKKYMECYSFPDAVVEIHQGIQAVDDGAYWIQREIAEYMKYGMWTMDFEENEAEQIWKGISGAEELSNIASKFSDCTKEALKLEKTVKKLAESLEKENQYGKQIQEGISSHQRSQISRAVKQYEKEDKKIQRYIQVYETTSDKMRQKIAVMKAENRKSREALASDVSQWVEKEENQYDTYIEQNGERYQQILEVGNISKRNVVVLQDAERIAEEVDEEVDDEEGEEGTTWDDVAVIMGQYQTITVPIQKIEGDEEKANLLETIKEWMEGDILTLILGRDANISKGKIKATNLPSKKMTERTKNDGLTQILSSIQMNAYIREFFQDYHNTDTNKNEFGKEDEFEKEFQYELEYLLAGKRTDRENLKQAIQEVWAMRTGLNLLYLYTDAEKRGEAEGLAMTIMGSIGLAPLVPILTFFILTVWAGAEAVMDVRHLLESSERKVPIWKTKGDWTLSVEGMLDLAKEGRKSFQMGNESKMQVTEKEEERGINYGAYVRVLLLIKDMREKTYRMMDVMQINISRKQQAFEIGNCFYYLDISVMAKKNHLFFSNQLSDNAFGLYADVQKAY